MNIKSITILVLSCVTWTFISCSHDIAGRETVTKKIKDGALIVDVRTPAEFKAGSYPGAINIPLNQIGGRIKEFGDSTKPIVLYCRSGNRSGKARKILIDHGFIDVTNGGGLRDMPVLK
jgi:phage shock protein E